jgi:GYF domain 2
MNATLWYVKLGEQSIGPMTQEELVDLSRNGNIGSQVLVSIDQLNWNPAGSLQGLGFASTPPPLPAFRASVPHPSVIWKLVACVAAGLLAIFVIVRAATPPEVQPFQPSADSSRPLLEARAANRAYQYWIKVSAILKTGSTNASAGVSALRVAAASVEGLPTAGVDPEAINAALAFAAVLTECADLVDSENNPSDQASEFVAGFYGGWSGDFQPLVHRLESKTEAHKTVASHIRGVHDQAIKTRAILSSRYGIEFPPL